MRQLYTGFALAAAIAAALITPSPVQSKGRQPLCWLSLEPLFQRHQQRQSQHVCARRRAGVERPPPDVPRRASLSSPERPSAVPHAPHARRTQHQ
jgi:hypothetical protein